MQNDDYQAIKAAVISVLVYTSIVCAIVLLMNDVRILFALFGNIIIALLFGSLAHTLAWHVFPEEKHMFKPMKYIVDRDGRVLVKLRFAYVNTGFKVKDSIDEFAAIKEGYIFKNEAII